DKITAYVVNVKAALHHFISTEKPKPTVRVNPQSSVYTGDRVTLTCNLKSTGWTFLWYKDYQELYLLSPGTRNTNTLSVTVSNEGVTQYYCKARWRNYDSEISDPATITVRARPKPVVKTSDGVTLTVSEKPKPELTSDLKGDVLTGNSVTLYCTLKPQSDGWKFYWSNHTQRTETETETYTYTIRSVSVSDGGQYRCRAGRGNPVYYTDYSDALWVNVNVLSDGKAPLSGLKLLSSAVASSPYVLVTIILAVKCYRARTDPDEDNRPYRVIEAEAS
ncbi:hypothetical protein AMELA_G00298480, partial [Ameiurus melas]